MINIINDLVEKMDMHTLADREFQHGNVNYMKE